MSRILSSLIVKLIVACLLGAPVCAATGEVIALNCQALLQANGISSSFAGRQINRWSKQKVLDGLHALHGAGFDLTATFLSQSKDKNPEAVKILSEAVGFDTGLKGLYIKALEYFDNDLNSALKAAGLQTTRISNKAQNWTVALAIGGLRALANSGYYPSRIFLTQSIDPEAIKILIAAVGFETTLSTLYNQCLKLNHGDFAGALKAADIFEPTTPSEKYIVPRIRQQDQNSRWTPELVRIAMRSLYEHGFLPTYKWLQKSYDPEATKILVEAVGFKTSLRSLLRNGLALHEDNFRKVLVASNLTFLVDYYANPEWTKEDVQVGLQALYERGYVTYSTMLTLSKDPEAKRVLSDAVGFETTLGALYVKARKFYKGNFALALHDAGLPEDEIMRANRQGIDPLALVPLQYEWVKTEWGMRLVPHIGEAPQTPVDNMQNQEVLDIAMKSLPENLRALGEEVLDIIMFSNLREPNAAAILAQIHKDGHQEATLEEVQMILQNMASSEELRNYLH